MRIPPSDTLLALVLAAVVLLLGCPGARPRPGPAPDETSPPPTARTPAGSASPSASAPGLSPARIIASFYQVPPDGVTITRSLRREGAVEEVEATLRPANANAPEQRIFARVNLESGRLESMLRLGVSGRGEAKIDQDTALRQAQEFLERHQVSVAGMELAPGKKLPMGVYNFVWEGRLAGAKTGDMISVRVSAGGEGVVGFTQIRAARQVSPSQVRISEERARQIALKLAEQGERGAPRQWRVEEAWLVLSYRYAPDSGPAWFVDLRAGEPDSRAIAKRLTLIIDAMNGEEILPPGIRR